jgi:hypothetical protein
MNPSVQPFYSHQTSTNLRPIFAQWPPQPMKSTRPAFVSKLNPSAPSVEADAIQPPYPSERLNTYQQAPNSIPWAFPPSPDMNGRSAPNHNTEALVADMWKSCPALCASIRQDFDLNVLFHPALIALHGETYLRLAASQIAMQNQAAEMTNMRHALSQKQVLLDANTASAKDLQTKLVSQQSELKEIRGLLEQHLQSLTNSDVVGSGRTRHSHGQRRESASQGFTVSPMTSASTLTAIDGTTQQFYTRSASLSPLKLSLPSDNVDKHVEKHGYGHAETQGPALQYDLAGRDGSGNDTGQGSDRPRSVPPAVSTSTIFEVAPSSASPIVSIGAKKQIARPAGYVGNQSNAGSAENYYHTSTAGEVTKSDEIKIMKREPGQESACQNIEKPVEVFKGQQPRRDNDTAPNTPPKGDSSSTTVHEKVSTNLSSKPVSYAAAARTTPAISSKDISESTKPPSTVSQNLPAPDLGFTLEPLPKPTIQQIQSQQQLPESTNTMPDAEATPFDFEEWKQQRIAEGTWEDRPRRSKPHHPPQRPYHPMYRGRGRRMGYEDNFRHGPMSEADRKQEWLTWKQNLVSQGRWNPTRPFREAWKNG